MVRARNRGRFLSWFFFREAMPPLKILGLCLVIVGMLFINLDKSAQEKAK